MSRTLPVKEHVKSTKNPGFLLPELLIALVVLMGLATVVATYQWQSARWHCEAAQQAAALTAVMNVIEQHSLFATLPSQGREIDGIKISWSRESVSVQTSSVAFMAAPQPRFELLHVTAQWTVAGKSRSLTVAAGACHA